MDDEVHLIGTIASLSYKALISKDLESPIAYLIHGRAGNRDVMWTFRRVIPDNYSIVTIEAPNVDPIGGFSWWQVVPEESKYSEILSISQVAYNFIKEFEVNQKLCPKFRVGLGFSQGAGLLSILIQIETELFSLAGLLAGFAIHIHDLNLANTRLPDVFMAHGTEDNIITIQRARESRDYLLKLGYKVAFYEEAVGHKVGAKSMRALKDWLQENRLAT